MESRASQIRVVASRSGSAGNRKSPGNPFRDPSNVRLYVPSPKGGKYRRSRVLRIGRFKLGGGEPRHELPLIDIGLTRTFITFPPGTMLATGQMFEIIRPIRVHAGFIRPFRAFRKVVALVKIVGIGLEARARVEVLRGSVRGGLWAERSDERRIADTLYDF
jgi:hypothetical protein